MSKHNKQIGKGGCFSTPKELKDLNIRLKKINQSLSGSLNSLNSLSPEEKDKLEKELNELVNEVQMNNNSNNATKRKQKRNNNNAIKRQLGLSDQEYSALSEELEKLEKELLRNSNV
jgi:hypothetical protein